MNPSNASNSPFTSGDAVSPSPSSSGAPDQESRLADVGRKAKDIAMDTAAQLKDKASSVASEAKERAAEIAGDQKTNLAERLHKASSSVHESAKKFEEEDPNIAWITHEAANRIQKVADYVRESDFATLQDDAENLIRRYPIACLGGLFVAGLVVGNLLKATANSASNSSTSAEKTGRARLAPSAFPTEENFVPSPESGMTGGSTLSGPPPAETMS